MTKAAERIINILQQTKSYLKMSQTFPLRHLFDFFAQFLSRQTQVSFAFPPRRPTNPFVGHVGAATTLSSGHRGFSGPPFVIVGGFGQIRVFRLFRFESVTDQEVFLASEACIHGKGENRTGKRSNGESFYFSLTKTIIACRPCSSNTERALSLLCVYLSLLDRQNDRYKF